MNQNRIMITLGAGSFVFILVELLGWQVVAASGYTVGSALADIWTGVHFCAAGGTVFSMVVVWDVSEKL